MADDPPPRVDPPDPDARLRQTAMLVLMFGPAAICQPVTATAAELAAGVIRLLAEREGEAND